VIINRSKSFNGNPTLDVSAGQKVEFCWEFEVTCFSASNDSEFQVSEDNKKVTRASGSFVDLFSRI